MSELLSWALKYARRGWPVLPCGIDKKPLGNLVPSGLHDASCDEKQIRDWWRVNPNASIGLPTGPPTGVFVLDVDLPDGPATLETLEELHGRLPETGEQRTGGGGRQLFFLWPSDGREVRNSVKKLGPGLDVRGAGGYIIAPPSGHPSGGKYAWETNGAPLANAPEWLLSLVCKKDGGPSGASVKSQPRACEASTSPYGRNALDSEAANVSQALQGGRNDTLNSSAFCVGQLVAGGEIDRQEAFDVLLDAARFCGLSEREATTTINSGFRAGEKEPRTAPENSSYSQLGDKCDSGDKCDEGDSGDTRRQNATLGDTRRQQATAGDTGRQAATLNLTQEIADWVNNSEGWFTASQVDTEFAIRAREDKKQRSKILNNLVRDGILKKDRQTKGRFCAIKTDLEFIDLDAVQENNFPINLPLGLDQMVSLPSGIAVLAGGSNAGKTAFLLEMLRLNLTQDYPLFYLMSEMGPSEYKQRLRLFGDNLDQWKAVKAASKSAGFDSIVKAHNPTGLTIVDYLEEIDGEYFKINSAIRDIYDALNGGLCWIALQKKTGATFGRGGEATQEKARLYLALDQLCHEPGCTICALKIVKAKCYAGDNPNGKEIHFKLIRGAKIEPITGWMYCNEKDREKAISQYSRGHGGHWNGFDTLNNGDCPF